ncbi:NAD-dependent epimerase/dehydratase family protein [Guptibacillus algicola]|uniref:NAD-dependent epimerase/dehydratase family protein n=1 Tax=Guptibacillus algicola TaxID=225844 RepID=UPI001CD2592E|nr:NAD-dependent epimerase/dehydratase family protein [Alkalihalobacillus algicola]MCA0987846.1 NAD-dependent epimerase/dehydratase family protein [Alkalihalobacillus algicola]
MTILVTGAAGFVGSHLCEQLLKTSETNVIGIDLNIEGNQLKMRNVKSLLKHPNFKLYDIDLLTEDLSTFMKNVDVIYHLAGIPGVRSSFGNDFESYILNNGLVTQRLLETCRHHTIAKFIYISTSSVYGEKDGKVTEDLPTVPLSPYGVTKLTSEQLCHIYHLYFKVPTVVLRYFTVYGPRQRPDMAFHRFIKQMLENKPITVYGDGLQSRDFTYVADCVQATAAVKDADYVIGETINIGGKERATVLEVISTLEELLGQKAKIDFVTKATGEPMHTWADISKAQKLLNYRPSVRLREGLMNEIVDLAELYDRKE